MSSTGDTETPEALLQRGMRWLQDHLLNHAEGTLRRVQELQPGNLLAQRLRGIALFKLGQRELGLALLRAAAEQEKRNPRAWGDLAVALRDAGDQAGAEAAYARALADEGPGTNPPGLAELVFCTEVVRHDFEIVDYPYRAQSRYGAGRPAHPELAAIIGAGRERYLDLLDEFAPLQLDFDDVPRTGSYDTTTPFWLNAWFSPLDAIALTGLLRKHAPTRFVEIGSGMSTKYARRAIDRYGLPTQLTSIDPQPRNRVDALCDEVIRQPLERCDLALFGQLAAGDVVFLDSSHRSFQGSDVTVFFLEILPRLAPGVIVHIHDVYLPEDYIAGHARRLWNEQYLLGTALLFGAERFEILFPSWFVRRDPDLIAHADGLFRKGPMSELDLYGASFWMRLR